MKRSHLDDTSPPRKRRSRDDDDSKYQDADELGFHGRGRKRLDGTDTGRELLHQEGGLRTSAAPSEAVSDNGAASLGRYPAASSRDRFTSRPTLHPLVSSASSSTSTARISNVSSNHPSESSASGNQQAMGSNPNPSVSTTLPQGMSNDVARSVLLQQIQRQQGIQRLEEVAMAQTLQQVRNNPSILNSVSQFSSIPPAAAASFPSTIHAPPAFLPPNDLLGPQQRMNPILGNAGMPTSPVARFESIPLDAASVPTRRLSLALPPPAPPPPVAGLSPEELMVRLQHQQQLDLILARDRQALMGPPPPPGFPSANPLLNPGGTNSMLAYLLSSLAAPNVHPPVDLYMPRDEFVLSEHQILLRKQMEFFEATPVDIQVFTPGRRKEISVGQVGLRCKHCARLLEKDRFVKGTMYFPSTLRALYQAAQNCGKVHLSDKCPTVSNEVKIQLKVYMELPTSSGYGGKQYWSDCAMERGVHETTDGLRFRR